MADEKTENKAKMAMLPFRNPLGRPLKMTPEQLAEKFAEYVEWCYDNPIPVVSKTEYANGNWAETGDYKPRLVSIAGFELYAGIHSAWWTQIVQSKRGAEFSSVKAEIKKFCEEYQKEMASAGIFNANIISRLLGLADRQQVDGKVDYKFKFGDGEQ